ncbi:hypothetical protein F5B17DRAFT_397293 [Nemania serpens]|nr:hypothetical protein F5B17DRAFT_397293 [Nemania serpens]
MAAEGLRKEFHRAQISVLLLDVGSYDYISAFAERCTSLPSIDIVLVNASLIGSKNFATFKDTGHECTLLDQLRADSSTSDSSSTAHY